MFKIGVTFAWKHDCFIEMSHLCLRKVLCKKLNNIGNVIFCVKKQGLDMDCLFYSMHLHSNANVHEL